jgi:hypothetical protein
LVRQGIPQEYIRRAILNPQTGKPLSIKTLELALRPEIETGTTELHHLVGDFIISAILGKKPTPRRGDQKRSSADDRGNFLPKPRWAGQRGW